MIKGDKRGIVQSGKGFEILRKNLNADSHSERSGRLSTLFPKSQFFHFSVIYLFPRQSSTSFKKRKIYNKERCLTLVDDSE
jgi:hypothetical protein